MEHFIPIAHISSRPATERHDGAKGQCGRIERGGSQQPTKLALRHKGVNNAAEELKEGESGALCNKVGQHSIKWG